MIFSILIATSVAAAPATATPSPSAHDILAGAEQAIDAGRVEQAALMISRAVSAGATGTELQRAEADLAYANERYATALASYEMLIAGGRSDARLLQSAGIAALKLGDVKRAAPLLERAVKSRGATWRAWNALGAVADANSNWDKADQAYARAARLAPDEAAPVNNRGWSFLLRGRWKDAAELFGQAVRLDPKSPRIANNLELANSALASDLPRRRPGESERSWAERLNDAGMAAALFGDKPRAVAAFTQALDASGTWYERAANNLEAINSK